MSEANRSSAPTSRGNDRSASSASREHPGDVLERLALDEAGEQQVALFPQCELLVEVAVGGARQQPPGLQLDQRGGDQQELGGDIEVERLHLLDLDQIGVDDGRQVDLVDVDLLLQDQLQEQIERPFVDRGRHVDAHCCDTLVANDTGVSKPSRIRPRCPRQAPPGLLWTHAGGAPVSSSITLALACFHACVGLRDAPAARPSPTSPRRWPARAQRGRRAAPRRARRPAAPTVRPPASRPSSACAPRRRRASDALIASANRTSGSRSTSGTFLRLRGGITVMLAEPPAASPHRTGSLAARDPCAVLHPTDR